MDVLDKFFIQYAYKFPKGYPDMNNDQDVLLMENILKEEFGIVLEISKTQIHLTKIQFYNSKDICNIE